LLFYAERTTLKTKSSTSSIKLSLQQDIIQRAREKR
jgi:hypothetical protein